MRGGGWGGLKGIRGIRRNKQLSPWGRTSRSIPLGISSKALPSDTVNQNTSDSGRSARSAALGRTGTLECVSTHSHTHQQSHSFQLSSRGVGGGGVLNRAGSSNST